MPRATLSAAVTSVAHLLGGAPRKRGASSPTPAKPAPTKAMKPSPKAASFAHLRDWNPGASTRATPSRTDRATSWDRAYARVAAEDGGDGKASSSSWDRAARRIGVTPG